MKGIFKPKNPDKYRGDPTGIVYRSSWELKVMMRFDTDPNVLHWSSEEVRIRYRSPIDGRAHTYYPDFLACIRQADGSKTFLIEVKPEAQTRPPEPLKGRRKPTKRYVNECLTWGKNSAKWEAAREWCSARDVEFILITERQLFLKE